MLTHKDISSKFQFILYLIQYIHHFSKSLINRLSQYLPSGSFSCQHSEMFIVKRGKRALSNVREVTEEEAFLQYTQQSLQNSELRMTHDFKNVYGILKKFYQKTSIRYPNICKFGELVLLILILQWGTIIWLLFSLKIMKLKLRNSFGNFKRWKNR